jgi:type II secretory pathway pseudopilin PulG
MARLRNKAGFTLVEALLSAAILAGAVLVLVAGTTRALGGTRLNRQRELAASLLDRQLSMIDYIGIEEFIELGQMEGEFDEFEGRYGWKVVTEAQDIGLLYKVSITVSWIESNRPYSVSVDTMLNGRGVNLETEDAI